MAELEKHEQLARIAQLAMRRKEHTEAIHAAAQVVCHTDKDVHEQKQRLTRLQSVDEAVEAEVTRVRAQYDKLKWKDRWA